MEWLSHLALPALCSYHIRLFDTPNVVPTRGFVISKPSALLCPQKINILRVQITSLGTSHSTKMLILVTFPSS